MILSGRSRKLALAVHLMFSVGWIGAALAYLALGIAATASASDQTVRGAWVSMELIGWYVLVPLALGSVLTGVVMALGAKWGLFRYYWVLFAFVLTTLATLVLVLHMPAVSSGTDRALEAEAAGQDLGGDLFHASTGLAVLLVILVLNVLKPPGLTRHGWRKQNQRAADDARLS